MEKFFAGTKYTCTSLMGATPSFEDDRMQRVTLWDYTNKDVYIKDSEGFHLYWNGMVTFVEGTPYICITESPLVLEGEVCISVQNPGDKLKKSFKRAQRHA